MWLIHLLLYTLLFYHAVGESAAADGTAPEQAEGEELTWVQVCSDIANTTLSLEGYSIIDDEDKRHFDLLAMCIVRIPSEDQVEPLYVDGELNLDENAPREAVHAMSHALMMIRDLFPKHLSPWAENERGR